MYKQHYREERLVLAVTVVICLLVFPMMADACVPKCFQCFEEVCGSLSECLGFLSSHCGSSPIWGPVYSQAGYVGSCLVCIFPLPACTVGQTRSCSAGCPNGGTQTCTNGQWGTCQCNECADGQTQPCYAGPAGTRGVGICQAGTQSCVNGHWASACQGEVIMQTETCDGKDNNCNGDIDEGVCQCSTNIALFSSANVVSGNLSHDQNLFSTKGSGLALNMTLYYNSLNTSSGPLGQKWTHNYDSSLRKTYDGSVILQQGNGDEKLYTKTSSGFTTQTDDYSTLVQNPDNTFIITYQDGQKYNFNQDGKITNIVDRNGNTVVFTYINGNLATVTDPSGRMTTLTYDPNNHIIAITDPAGTTRTFSYSNSMLTGVTTPDPLLGSLNWSYTYDNGGFMLAKADPNGNTTSYTYDADHRIVSAVNPEGQTKTIIYSSGDKTSQMIESDGGVWTYKYDTSLGVLFQKIDPNGNSTSHTYDLNKNMTAKTDPDGAITSYTYDAGGNMTSTTDALGQTTSYTYNAFGQVTSINDPEGNVTTFSHDARGNLIATTDSTGVTTTYQYDSKGNATRVITASGQTTTYAYNQQNNLISITDSTGATTRFTNDANGNVTSLTDANGNTTTFVYNGLNQLMNVTDPNGNITTYTYDKNGNKMSMTNANGNVTYYEYNYNGQLIQIKDALGNITSYAYGGTGCPSCGGGGDKLTLIVDANGNTTKYEYDMSGRRIREIDALGNVASYIYDAKGNVLTRTDANGHVTSFTYDPLSRLKAQTDPLLGVVKFGYTTKGQIATVIDPLGNATTYEYDSAERVTKTVSPDTGRTTYTYNTTGALATKTDASGVTISYRYDSLNRLTTIDFPTDTDIIYIYDTCTNGKGRLCAMTDPSGSTAYEYDKLGRIVRETKTILGVSYTTSYSYDKVNNLMAIVYPSGRKVEYDYDKLNRPIGVVAYPGSTATLANKIIYDPIANIKSMSLGNGLTQVWTYDPNNRIKSISVPGIVSVNYVFDPVGNITNITDQFDPTKSKTLIYDPLNRLVSATGPWGTLGWTYDANGNRLSQTNGEHYTYNYNANRLMTVTNGHVDSYQYDNNGNTVSDGKKDFVYNQNQRFIRVEKHGRPLGEYVYDGNGRRTIKNTEHENHSDRGERDDDDSHHITVFHYDLSGQLIEETTANGKLIADHVYLNGKPLAMIRKQEHKDEIFYYHNDHLGTPKVMTDKLRKVAWKVEFDPFGNVVDDEENKHRDRDSGEDREHEHHGRHGEYIREVTNNLRFPGQYFDAETELNYNYFRDYNPAIGRYLESDRIGLAGGINLFTYVGAEPVDRLDAVGLWPSQKGAYVHQRAIYLNIGNNLPQNLRVALINGQIYADSAEFQNGSSAFRHAMRNKGQLECQARKLANDFVRRQFDKAWEFKKNGLEEAALFEFSVGLHTLQDWTSPTHHGFQEWSGNETAGEVFSHTLGELYNPGGYSELYGITRDAMKWYINGALPTGDLFGSYGAD